MTEEVVNLGSESELFGILTTGELAPNSPVVLMFNAGFLHHVGPFRLWVDLSRELAQRGIPSLRFDLGGLGDSRLLEAAPDDPAERALRDLANAMDGVERRLGKRDFIVIGLCSGADLAHPAMKRDPRIRGGVLIDGYGYRTPQFYKRRKRHLLRRAFSIRGWISLILRKLKPAGPVVRNEMERDFQPSEQIQAEIQGFLREGRRLLYVYTSSLPYLNYKEQFWDMFPRLKPGPELTCKYYENVDHTFSLLRDRQDLTRTLLGFISESGKGIGKARNA
jgi:pimeloyl-ACP methyl ester carboxylesterase